MYKEYGIEGRYNWRGQPYHMIINALQTVLHFYKNYLSDVQLPRMQEPILYISYTNGVPSEKHI